MNTNKYLMNLVFEDSDTGREEHFYTVTTPLTKEEVSELLYKADKILMMGYDYSTVSEFIESYKELEEEDLPVDVAELALHLYEDMGHNPEPVTWIASALNKDTKFEGYDEPKVDFEVFIEC